MNINTFCRYFCTVVYIRGLYRNYLRKQNLNFSRLTNEQMISGPTVFIFEPPGDGVTSHRTRPRHTRERAPPDNDGRVIIVDGRSRDNAARAVDVITAVKCRNVVTRFIRNVYYY